MKEHQPFSLWPNKSSPSGKRETIKELCALKIKYNPGLNKPRDPNSISKDIYSQYFF